MIKYIINPMIDPCYGNNLLDAHALDQLVVAAGPIPIGSKFAVNHR